MASKALMDAVASYEAYILQHGIDENVIDTYVMAAHTALMSERDSEYGLKLTARCKEITESLIKAKTGVDIWALEAYCEKQGVTFKQIEVYYLILKLESFWKFESFIFCMERNRPQCKRFYLPRKKTLHTVVADLEDLRYRRIKHYCLSMPPRVGKSTICIFYLAWSAFRSPNAHSAMGGHSGLLAKGFYKELLNLMTTEEYTFAELYAFFHPGHEIVVINQRKNIQLRLMNLTDLPQLHAAVLMVHGLVRLTYLMKATCM